MKQIDRSALAQSGVAGGAVKQTSFSFPCSGTDAPQVSGTTSKLVVVNGQVVANETRTYGPNC
jgi:hypothetical protein